eukprot:5818254-Pleurochrysis_carterae.AAC.1
MRSTARSRRPAPTTPSSLKRRPPPSLPIRKRRSRRSRRQGTPRMVVSPFSLSHAGATHHSPPSCST